MTSGCGHLASKWTQICKLSQTMCSHAAKGCYKDCTNYTPPPQFVKAQEKLVPVIVIILISVTFAGCFDDNVEHRTEAVILGEIDHSPGPDQENWTDDDNILITTWGIFAFFGNQTQDFRLYEDLNNLSVLNRSLIVGRAIILEYEWDEDTNEPYDVKVIDVLGKNESQEIIDEWIKHDGNKYEYAGRIIIISAVMIGVLVFILTLDRITTDRKKGGSHQ